MKNLSAIFLLHLAIIIFATATFTEDMNAKIILCMIAIIVVECVFILCLSLVDKYQFIMEYAQSSAKQARESMISAQEDLFFFQQESKFLKQVNLNKYKRAERQRVTNEIMQNYTTGKLLLLEPGNNLDRMTSYPLSSLSGQTMI